MLQALNQLGDVGVRVIKASKVATIDSLRQLQPVLNQLAASGDNFVKAFHVFLTYPFVDEVVGRDPQVARNLHMGDYTNLSVTLEIDLSQGGLPTDPTDILPTELDPNVLLQNVLACIASGNLGSPACLKVLKSAEALAKLKEVCQEPANRTKTVCVAINGVPGGPAGHEPELPGLPGLPDLPGLSELAGLGRTGPWNDAANGGPTMAQLQTVYDPSLVNLLVPQMVIQSSTKAGDGQ